jgi:hypothetical protein
VVIDRVESRGQVDEYGCTVMSLDISIDIQERWIRWIRIMSQRVSAAHHSTPHSEAPTIDSIKGPIPEALNYGDDIMVKARKPT